MNVLGVILKAAVAFTFIFTGCIKLFQIKESVRFFRDWGIFPPKIGILLGFGIPPVELMTGIALILNNNVLVEIFALAIIVFLVAINTKAVIDQDSKPCFCFGNFIQTRLGIGGLIHTVYLLLALFVSIFMVEITVLNLFYTYSIFNQILICSIALLTFVNGISIRLVLDKLAA